MPHSKTHSFCTNNELDEAFVQALKIEERKKGRTNFSWIVIKALKLYAQSVKEENKNG